MILTYFYLIFFFNSYILLTEFFSKKEKKRAIELVDFDKNDEDFNQESGNERNDFNESFENINLRDSTEKRKHDVSALSPPSLEETLFQRMLPTIKIIITNPPLITMIVGFILGMTHCPLPKFITDVVHTGARGFNFFYFKLFFYLYFSKYIYFNVCYWSNS